MTCALRPIAVSCIYRVSGMYLYREPRVNTPIYTARKLCPSSPASQPFPRPFSFQKKQKQQMPCLCHAMRSRVLRQKENSRWFLGAEYVCALLCGLSVSGIVCTYLRVLAIIIWPWWEGVREGACGAAAWERRSWLLEGVIIQTLLSLPYLSSRVLLISTLSKKSLCELTAIEAICKEETTCERRQPAVTWNGTVWQTKQKQNRKTKTRCRRDRCKHEGGEEIRSLTVPAAGQPASQ